MLEVVRVAAFWNLHLLQFDMAHRFADEGWPIGQFAIWPRCWPGGKNRTMALDLGSCSCLPSPFNLGLPVGHQDGSSLDAPFARLFVWDLLALIGSREMWRRVPEFLACYPIRCWPLSHDDEDAWALGRGFSLLTASARLDDHGWRSGHEMGFAIRHGDLGDLDQELTSCCCQFSGRSTAGDGHVDVR
ncbi:hypothetical protein ACLOJK_029393 [Asimina triloba]